MKWVLSVFLIVAAIVVFNGRADTEQLRIGNNLRQEKILLPPSAPDKSRLVVLDDVMVEDEEMGLGILVFYDDLRTKLKIDYVEFYDVAGNLLLMSWIDRFGICQVAIDRGLLDVKHPGVDGVLVPIPSGTEL